MGEKENNNKEYIQNKIKIFAYQTFSNLHKSYKNWLTKYKETKY